MTTPQHANRSLSEWLILGKSALLSHRGEKAEHAFATILRSDPEHPEALQGLMTAWLLLGKSDQVIEYVE
jgi:cytochrome c-type biogenesis protein CcmH/NrfG